MLVRKDIIKGGIKALNNEPREMINNKILSPRLVLDLQVKLL